MPSIPSTPDVARAGWIGGPAHALSLCGAQDTKVVDLRLHGDGDQVRRRRECTVCERFTTYEAAELNLPRVEERWAPGQLRRAKTAGRYRACTGEKAGIHRSDRCRDQPHHAAADGRR